MDASAVARLLADGSTTFVLHRHADADCVGAAGALAEAFGGELWAPAGVSAVGKRIAASLGREVATEPGRTARFVLVDVSTWGQLDGGGARVRAGAFGLVDHHAYGDAFEGALFLLRDPSRASSCEIALDLLAAAGRAASAAARVALLAGIVADSGRFRWGNAATLRAAAALVDAGTRMEDAYALLEEEPADERSARIARLKAARRARLAAVGERILATSVVGSHESAAAMGLVRLGADVALVAAPTHEGARVTARAAADVPVHLGETLNALARAHPEAGAAGGGHEASAGFRASGDPEAWLARARARVVEALGGRADDLEA